MEEIQYSADELLNVKYVKVTYIGSDNTPHELKTDVKYLDNDLVSLKFRYKETFDIQYPQEVSLKFVMDDCMYLARAILRGIERANSFIYLSIEAPKTIIKHQKRKFYRIILKRTCVLIATDKEGHSTAFMSRLADVSAGGLWIHKLESMFNNEYVSIEPEKYEYFNIVLFLDIDIVLKLSARYVRQEMSEESCRYAFEFIDMKQNDIDTIGKYVIKEQQFYG